MNAEANAKSMSMIVTKGSLDWAYPPFILATTAAAMGLNVTMFFTFYGLTLLKKKLDLQVTTLGNPAMAMPMFGMHVGMPNIVSAIPGVDAAASVMMKNLIKKNPRYSKRINYDALRDLFDGGATGAATDEKIDLDADLWHMDKEDDDAGVLIEEGGGGVGMTPAKAGPSKTAVATDTEAADEDEAGVEVEEELYDYTDKVEDYAEWDVYEQEV